MPLEGEEHGKHCRAECCQFLPGDAFMKKLITLILCFAAITYSTGALAADTLMADTNLTAGQYLVSRNGIYVLIMQPDDGNLVLYYRAFNYTVPAGFSTNQAGSNAYARMQSDGNFVVYKSDGNWFWASHTGGRPYDMSYKLELTDYGSLFIRDGAGNVVKQIFADDYYCSSRQQAANYPVCSGGTTNSFVSATCGLTALHKAAQMNASVGACR
jgi:hypothetical protein